MRHLFALALCTTAMFTAAPEAEAARGQLTHIEITDFPSDPAPEQLLGFKAKDVAKAVTSDKVCIQRLGMRFITHSVGHVVEGGGGPGRLKAKRGLGRKMNGVDEATRQKITDQAHADLAEALKANGFTVLTWDECKKSKKFSAIAPSDNQKEFVLKPGKVTFNFAQALATFTGAARGQYLVPTGTTALRPIFGDVLNSAIKSGKAAGELDAIMLEADFVIDFTVHAGDIQKSVSHGGYYDTITTKWEIRSEDVIFPSFFSAAVVNKKFKMGLFTANTLEGSLPGVKNSDRSYITGARETNDAFDKRVNTKTVEIDIDADEYAAIANMEVKTYVTALAKALAANKK